MRGTDIEHDKDKHARKARPCGDMSTLASLSCVPTCSFDGKDNTPSTGYVRNRKLGLTPNSSFIIKIFVGEN